MFVGLVTHPRSRFADARGEAGLQNGLAEALTAGGWTVRLGVSDQDAYSPELLPLTRDEVRASIVGELDSDRRWREYVSGSSGGFRMSAFMAARRVYRTVKFAPPWRRRLEAQDPGAAMVRRLVNIELSHLRILDDALASGSRWSLILEDDAFAPDVEVFAQELSTFIERAEERGEPVTVNLSESFSPEVLGVTPLLTPVPSGEVGVPWTAFRAARPVTNTVCAVLYRRDFLLRLREALSSVPLSPVLPIDFKMNEAVMAIASDCAPGDCWVLSPAPVQQRSGVPVVRVNP